MKTIRLGQDNHAAMAEAAKVLRAGGVVVFPAERIYGLAADAQNPAAVLEIFRLKGRSDKKPLPLMAPDAGIAAEFAAVPAEATPLIRRFWPGPLTMVLPLRKKLPPELGLGGEVGIRVPGNPAALELLKAFGGILTATSSNKSGGESGRTAEEAVAQLASPPELVLNAGELPGPPPSTVVRVRNGKLEILREGIIPADLIQKVFNKELG